jgi:hypothetical protein
MALAVGGTFRAGAPARSKERAATSNQLSNQPATKQATGAAAYPAESPFAFKSCPSVAI